jgi:hypothetical protein
MLESYVHLLVFQSDVSQRPWTVEHLALAYCQAQALVHLVWVLRPVSAYYLVRELVLLASAWRQGVKSAVPEKVSIAAAQSIDLAHVDFFKLGLLMMLRTK